MEVLMKKTSMTLAEVLYYKKIHIIKGDTGDGVCNILSPPETLMTPGIRQIVMTKKRLNHYMNMSEEEIMADIKVSQRYQDNKLLVDLDQIPEDIVLEVINLYDLSDYKCKSTMRYFMKNNLSNLVGVI
jgi:hypothetical protein